MTIKNKRIACTPPKSKGLELGGTSGFAVVKTKTELLPMTVVIGDGLEYSKGDTIWVRGDAIKLAWAVDVYTLVDEPFVLVPIDAVLCHSSL